MKLLARISSTSALLALAIAACAQTPAQSAGSSRPAMPEFEPVPVGAKAPDFQVTTPEEKTVSLSDYKGKIVLIDFWATWCGPCQRSMPQVEKIANRIKSQGVVVLSVNTWDDKQAFKDYVKKNLGTKYHFDFVRDPAEGDHDTIRNRSIAKRLYKVIGIPTLYVIDRKGNVAGSVLGSGNEAALVKILDGLGVHGAAEK